MNTQDLQKKAEAIKQELLALKQKGYTDTSQIKGDLSSLPSLTPSPEKTLPESSPSNLLSFKDVLSKATDLAREKRNALSLSFMSSVAPSGTMAASDFNSILGNMNTASEKFIEEKIKGTQSKFELRNVGDNLVEIETDSAGRFLNQRVISNSKPVFSFSNEDKRKLIGAGLTGDDLEKIQKDLIQYGADSIIDGLDNENKKKTLKQILSGETKMSDEDVKKIINENLDLTDDELKLKLQNETGQDVSKINSYVDTRVSNDDLKFEAEGLVTDFYDPSLFDTKGTELKKAKDKAIEDIKGGGTIKIDNKSVTLSEEVQKRIIDFINSVGIDTVKKIRNKK